MKKLSTLLLLFIVSISFGQTKQKFFSQNDITYLETIATFKPKTFLLKNGLDEFIEVKIGMSSTKESLNKLTIEKLNMIIQEASIKTKYSLKNKSTYRPLKVFVAYLDNEWTISINYTAQNDYGATKDGTSYIMFDDLGVFKSQL